MVDYSSSDISHFHMQFNNLAYKIGNLERPFLKEFFPSWVESCGCPILRFDFRCHCSACYTYFTFVGA